MTLKVVDHPDRNNDMKKTVFELDGCTVTFEAESDITVRDFYWYLEQVRMAIWHDLRKSS